MTFQLYRASRVDRLLEPLIASLRNPPADPFDVQRIVVQSAGMQRWLSHQIAQHLDDNGRGVMANITFDFPATIVTQLSERFTVHAAANPGAPPPRSGGRPLTESPSDRWQLSPLTWALAQLLAEPGGVDDGFLSEVIAKVERSPGVVSRPLWRLASAIAEVFDGYRLYRPEMVAEWSRGGFDATHGSPLADKDRWQPQLWRALVERIGDPVAPFDESLAHLHETDGLSLPHLRIFGLSILPPRYLALLSAWSRHAPVEMFVPVASPARWRMSSGGQTLRQDPPRHPLVAACGQLGDEAALLFARIHVDAVEIPWDVDDSATTDTAAASSLLAQLQADIAADVVPTLVNLDADDRSVTLHRCHGATRQAETVVNTLLALLAADETLQPRDVLIMTPDVERFAPLLQAAFAGDGQRGQIPVRLADRTARATDVLAECVLAMLALARGRGRADEIADLIALGPVAAKFGFGRDEQAAISGWIEQLGVRWGFDDDHRSRHGARGRSSHSWRAVIDRLLVGVTMADEQHRLVGGVAPYDHVEGSDLDVVGRLATLLDILADLAARLCHDQTVEAWCGLVVELVEATCVLDDDDAWMRAELDGMLAELAELAGDVVVSFATFHDVVTAAWDRPRGAMGYETGAVTVCDIVPMRSIPHRVVALVGLDDQLFPRSLQRPGFDLAERPRRIGDRDRRDEDRFLFLEAVMAARDHLVVSCTARDVHSNAEVPPSTVVADFVDTLQKMGVDERSPVIIDEPLQPFAAALFDASQGAPRSFDTGLLAAARQLQQPGSSAAFLTDPLAPPTRGDQTLATLIEAVTHPIRFLLRDRLGVVLDERAEQTDHVDPVQVGALEAWSLRREGLALPAGDEQAARRWARYVATLGHLPGGTLGQVELEDLLATVDDLHAADLAVHRELAASFAATGQADTDGDSTAGQADTAGAVTSGPRQVSLQMASGHRLTGQLEQVHDLAGALRLGGIDPRTITAPRRLQRWIEHLVGTLVAERTGQHALTCWVHRQRQAGRASDAKLVWYLPLASTPTSAAEIARERLEELERIADEAAVAPVPLLPNMAETLAKAADRSSDQSVSAAALNDAEACLRPASYAGSKRSGELDAYVTTAFGPHVTVRSLLADFPDLIDRCRALWLPIINHGGQGAVRTFKGALNTWSET